MGKRFGAWSAAVSGRPRRQRGLGTAVRRLEKHEQADAVKLLVSLGAEVKTFGTSRPRPNPTCAVCRRNSSTRQSPGIADVEAFLPPPRYRLDAPDTWRLLKYECKRDARERLSPDQQNYQLFCQRAGIAHVWGPLNALIAWLVREGYLHPSQLPHDRLPKGL